MGEPDSQRAVRRRAVRRFHRGAGFANALLAAALALAAGGSLISLMALSRFGRNWRAYADDPLGAQMLGVDPERDFRPDLRAGERIRGPRRLRHDDVLRRGRLRLWDDARPEGAGRGDSRRHRFDPGRVLGGIFIGIFEAIWSSAFPIDYRDVAIFSLLAIMLTLRPGGILGAPEGADER